MSNDPLAALRDIHLPPDPGWWPPAPGYWLIAALVLLGLAALAWSWRRRRNPSLSSRAVQELARVQRRFAVHADARRLADELSGLLRRVAVALHGTRVAGLSGVAWARHLASASPERCDPRLWEYLAEHRYREAPARPEPGALLLQCRRWLRHILQ